MKWMDDMPISMIVGKVQRLIQRFMTQPGMEGVTTNAPNRPTGASGPAGMPDMVRPGMGLPGMPSTRGPPTNMPPTDMAMMLEYLPEMMTQALNRVHRSIKDYLHRFASTIHTLDAACNVAGN